MREARELDARLTLVESRLPARLAVSARAIERGAMLTLIVFGVGLAAAVAVFCGVAARRGVLAEARLRASELRYREAVGRSGDALRHWDVHDGTVEYSPRVEALLGFAAGSLPRRADAIERALIHPNDRQPMRHAEALRHRIASSLP